MKKIILLSALCMALSLTAQERQVSALFTHSTFNIPGDAPYVETYLLIDAWSLEFVPANGKYQATIDLEIVARKVSSKVLGYVNTSYSVDDRSNSTKADSICYVKKYSLNSPAVAKPTDDQFQFLDLQRFSLANGVYVLELTAKDHNTTAKPQTITDTLFVAYPSTTPSISSIQLISSITPTQTVNKLSRGGYDMVPYTNSFVPESMKKLNFYFEIYNINNEIKEGIIATHSYLETMETGRKIGGTDQYMRHKPDTIVAEYNAINISDLPSGNYNLVVEVVNVNNEMLLFRKFPFQRSNPKMDLQLENYSSVEYTDSNFATRITDEKEITYYIKGLWPVANAEERNFITHCNELSLEEKQHFLFMFWAKRSLLDPETEWEKYLLQLKFVEKEFGYGKTPGYNTDRGRVYLQYGPPNYIIDGHHKVSVRNHQTQGQVFYYPYEMWRYDMLPADEPKRMFVFFDEFQAGDYKLLHSNAKGEVQDMLWERRLSRNMLDEYVQGEAGMQFERGY